MEDLLTVENVRIAFTHEGVDSIPVRSVSLRLSPGERVALVGESGCGKSLTAMSLTRLSPTDHAKVTGRVLFRGRDLLTLPPHELMMARGRQIAYVFQDSSASLNPVMRVDAQVTEALPGMSRAERTSFTAKALQEVGLPDPGRAARAFPCELSGGQQQRVMLAMALAANPALLVADEPTTALDVTTQRQVLNLICGLAEARKMAVLLITHNLGLVAGRMQRVYVMYAGEIVESGPVVDVLSSPRHPYTCGLLEAVPMLDAPPGRPLRDIPGMVPSPDSWPEGCVFGPRCPLSDERCNSCHPELCVNGNRECRCWKGVK
jgi:oligopeptide/dipeptide ABC transporter ATP-binding protein